MTSKILIDSYANVRVSPSYLKTWGPENGYEILGFAAYLWGSDNALCGQTNPPEVQAITHTWLRELTNAGMGLFGNLELGANDPDVLGGQGGIDRATLAVDCYKVLGAPKDAVLCLSNDAIVTNEANVIAFYTEADRIIRAAGYEPAIYGQSSVYKTLLAHGIEWLWHAPDGTEGEPQPAGTICVQRPNFYINPQGYGCDVDDVVDVAGRIWNLDGIIGAPAPKPTPPPAPKPEPPKPPTSSVAFPLPDDQKGLWFLTLQPASAASFFIVNEHLGLRHGFLSSEAELLGVYRQAGFMEIQIPLKTVLALKEV